jgi:hypothetical protein
MLWLFTHFTTKGTGVIMIDKFLIISPGVLPNYSALIEDKTELMQNIIEKI